MYKNQLQELAQRSCFNLPSYSCIREGPDHAPRFKATVNFNGEIFESPNYCLTLRQAEHSAAEVALSSLSHRGPSYSLAARILDETGVYKNLLQEISQRVGAPLPQYTTYRSGLGHLPVFTGTVELAGIIFTGDPAKNKKQAEKNAAMAAWSSLKQLAKEAASSSSETEKPGELEQITIARALLNYRLKEKIALADSPNSPSPYPRKFPIQTQRPPSPQPPSAQTSKILPLICPRTAARQRALSTSSNDNRTSHPPGLLTPRPQSPSPESRMVRPQKFPAPSATPYVPIRQFRMPCHAMAPPVTIRTAVPVFSAPPLPASPGMPPQFSRAPPVRIAPPVSIRQAVPVFAAPVVQKENSLFAKKEDTFTGMASTLQNNFPAQAEETKNTVSPPIQGSNNVCNFLQVQKEDPSASKREDPLAVKASTLPYKSPSEVDKTGSTNLNAVKEYEVIPSLERLKV